MGCSEIQFVDVSDIEVNVYVSGPLLCISRFMLPLWEWVKMHVLDIFVQGMLHITLVYVAYHISVILVPYFVFIMAWLWMGTKPLWNV